jgi:hypothetical protein
VRGPFCLAAEAYQFWRADVRAGDARFFTGQQAKQSLAGLTCPLLIISDSVAVTAAQ